ncbi:shikimate kinase [Phenylobacterium deserti]|uniref:Shikimate kinase n=1 Tax=Phenylobacterium deserti TaxID=1914756 RepID=A0A328AI35_9CAUL|nr:shikimate kinase [Phenylobacterium deserti]RAK52508.1 shikimate kinase [Phenylobacterium deserti]
MQLVFIYGQVAAGKLTVARELAELSGLALFHNHLVVDAVGSVFPFGSSPFVRLRESFWLSVFEEAARADTSLIFTFAPEPTVERTFPERARDVVAEAGGSTLFVALEVDPQVQEQRLLSPDRAAFGKMTSLPLFQSLRTDFASCFAQMPRPDLTIDTTRIEPRDAAVAIARRIGA